MKKITQGLYKDVVDNPNYRISTNGDVYSKLSNRLLKAQVSRSGYLLVFLSYNGKTKGKLVHRLVAEAFIPNPSSKLEVNHIDCNKLNNCLDNLEWCTKYENVKHAQTNRRYKVEVPNGYAIRVINGKRITIKLLNNS